MPKRFYGSLYFFVLLAILLGVVVGYADPALAVQFKPLGDGFIKLIKMLIAPIIFTTVVVGIANIGDLKKVGRVGIKALVYFELVTTMALAIGLLVANVYQPGAGMNVDPKTLPTDALQEYTTSAKHLSGVAFVLNIIPDTVVGAFSSGEILQVLLFAILFGLALASLGQRGHRVLELCEQTSHVLFGIVRLVMYLAPLGAFGAMSFTIGKYGLGALASLARLMGSVYLTCLLFVFVVLGLILRLVGFNIWRLLVYIKEELLLVLGTSSSESALPLVMAKLERLGCSKSVVGMVIPTGYSFNLDGTSIYLTMAVLFIAQATNTQLSIGQQLAILGLLMLTSKGAAAVTGGGFITLAATLSAVSDLPVAGLALLLGVDRFMSEARALTNLVGNTVATIVISRWEGELDLAQAHAVLDSPIPLPTTGSPLPRGEG